jgi:hypothetical protein
MEYQKTNINAFAGVDVNKRPEMLAESQASDIENLRFDKIGYLINRNGVLAKPLRMIKARAIDVSNVLWPIGVMGMTEYILKAPWGPGSGTTSWAPYDDTTINALFGFPQTPPKRFSDKFMVSFVRIPAYGTASGSGSFSISDEYNYPQRDANEFPTSPENHYTWRYKGAYVIMPLFGPSDFRDTFAFLPNGFPYNITQPNPPLTSGSVIPDPDYPNMYVTIGARSILRADDKPKKTQIYAPTRWLGVHNTFDHENNPKDANWIEHYVSMNQYRDSVIISDMTNGDLQLVDEYSEAEYSEERKHRFTLRENALAPFDVDDVIVDFGIGDGQFNNGVKTPMALYKFYLPKKEFTVTADNYTPTFVGASVSPSYKKVVDAYDVETTTVLNIGSDDFDEYWKGLNYTETNSFITSEYWEEKQTKVLNALLPTNPFLHAAGSSATFNVKQNYVFTNNESADEYFDLFGKLTLSNPDIKQDDQVAADVYKWQDAEISYYPSSGVNNTSTYFLTARDRSWNKSSSSAPRLIKLKTKKGVEQDVPLGVWRYRFVWYLGNGEYSAPSADLVLPDLIFSAIKDSDIAQTGITYTRPIGLNENEDSYRTNLELGFTDFINKQQSVQHLKMFAGSGLIPTEFGKNFIIVKEKLYKASHTYAAKSSTTAGVSWPASWNAESTFAKGQVCVSCTLQVENDSLSLNGVAGETAYSILNAAARNFISPGTQIGDLLEGSLDLKVLNYSASTFNLELPLFSEDNNNSSTYNSLFTDNGCIRTAIQNHERFTSNAYYSNQVPSYQIVFEGRHRFGISSDSNFTSMPTQDEVGVSNDLATGSSKVYVNIVPFQTLYGPVNDYERNNEDDITVYPLAGTKKRYDYRNMTLARGVKDVEARLGNIKRDVPTEVIDRILMRGYAEIKVCDFGDKGTWTPQKTQFNNYETFKAALPLTNDLLDRYIKYDNTYQYSRRFTPVNTFSLAPGANHDQHLIKVKGDQKIPYTNQDFISFDPVKPTQNLDVVELKNLKIVASFAGERLTIAEQLSMYVPASLLFEAPHIKLVIPSDRIPRRARQLMIFRSRASHDNAWQPHEYGLVKAVDITRDRVTGLPSGDQQQKLVFLDDVKNQDMDFSYSLSDFDGFTEPIRSRFSMPLNERVFYANIKESYKPQSPRNAVKITADPIKPNQVSHKNLNVGTLTEIERLWSYRFFTGTAVTTNVSRRYLYYFLAYNDAARSYSLASFSGMIDRGDLQVGDNAKKKILMYCLPSAYDETIEHVNIYRLQTDSPLAAVPFGITVGANTDSRVSTNIYKTGVFYVAQGVVEYNGVVYYPNAVIKAFDGSDSGVPGLGNWAQNPYKSAYLNRFVDYFSQLVAPYQTPPFAGKTNRGPQASYCQPIIYDITAYFDNAGGVNYLQKIGDITPENEGIFYDDDLPSLGSLPLMQFFQNEDIMPAGVRWSEPYQPNKIKLGSIAEVRSGDGDQITGIAQLYGNIIILKERSIHRLTVQGSTIPISRVDEISNNVGCIAPNTIITVDNTLYFLSWGGFYKYDNNVLTKIDGDFAEELQVRLRSNVNGVSNPAIRDASCGWNPTYRELYLNIPVMSTDNNEGHYGVTSMNNQTHTQGVTLMDNVGVRNVRAMVYSISLDTNFVTKYRYMDDSLYFTDPSSPAVETITFPNAPSQRAPRVSARLYYTNTLGQLRSSEVLPPRTYNYNITVNNVIVYPTGDNASISYLQTSFYIESPTKEANTSFDKYRDDMFIYTLNTISGLWFNSVNFRNVRVFWSSKSWTNDDKTMLKRVRKVFAYVSSGVQPTVIRGIVHTSPLGGRSTTDITWQYSYYFSDPNNPAYPNAVTGELLAIPTEASGASTSPSQNRGERHLFQVEGGGAFQMEYFGFYWKPINPYQR